MDFDPEIHICKFFYSPKDEFFIDLRPKVSADMYLNELKIEITDRDKKVISTFGYRLEGELDLLLPLLIWEDFEKYRDISEDKLKYSGYRDGWGYEFLCMNESGRPLIRNHLGFTFGRGNMPPYERLWDMIVKEYSGRKEFKKYKILW